MTPLDFIVSIIYTRPEEDMKLSGIPGKVSVAFVNRPV